jgi:hypothetical protein
MRKLRLILALASIECFASTSHALYQDFGDWNGLFVSKKIGPETGLMLEIQTRLHGGEPVLQNGGAVADPLSTRSNRLLIRPAFRWWIHPDLQLWAGYAWTPNFSPYRNEHRLWQQILYTHSSDHQFETQYRLRVEERDIQNSGGWSFRVRGFSRLDRWFEPSGAWGWVLWDELFWNLNTVSGGPTKGFDQNRIFLGPKYRLGERARFEFGYLNVWSALPSPSPDILAHLFATYLFIDLN